MIKMSKLKVDNFYQFFVYLIYLYHLIIDKELIKVLKKVGFGYKDFKFLRGRILYSFADVLSDSTRNKNTLNIKNNK